MAQLTLNPGNVALVACTGAQTCSHHYDPILPRESSNSRRTLLFLIYCFFWNLVVEMLPSSATVSTFFWKSQVGTPSKLPGTNKFLDIRQVSK